MITTNTDYWDLDHLLWTTKDVFGALSDYNSKYLKCVYNNESLNNMYRYKVIPNQKYWQSPIYHARDYSYLAWSDKFSCFLNTISHLGIKLQRIPHVEILMIDYDCFSPSVKFNFQSTDNNILLGVRFVYYRTKHASRIIMTDVAHSLFYRQKYSNNKYFN